MPDDNARSTDISNLIAGAENIYIHVHKDNLPAWSLYNQIGFKVYALFVVSWILIFFLKLQDSKLNNTYGVYF